MMPTSKMCLYRLPTPIAAVALMCMPVCAVANTSHYLMKVANDTVQPRTVMPHTASSPDAPVAEASVVLPTWQWSNTELAHTVDKEASLGAVGANVLGKQVHLEQSASNKAFSTHIEQPLSRASSEQVGLSDPTLTQLGLFSSDLSVLDRQSHLFSGAVNFTLSQPVEHEKPAEPRLSESIADIATAAGGGFDPSKDTLTRPMTTRPTITRRAMTKRSITTQATTLDTAFTRPADQDRLYWTPIHPARANPESSKTIASVDAALEGELFYQQEIDREAHASSRNSTAEQPEQLTTSRELNALPGFMKRVHVAQDDRYFESLDRQQLQPGFNDRHNLGSLRFRDPQTMSISGAVPRP